MAITLLKPFNLDTTGNYTFNTVTSNIKTDNIMYSNGSPYVFSSNAAGSNTQIQFNNANSFGASSAFTFNNSTNVVTLTGNITTNNANLGNLVTANFLTGTLTTQAQPNITSTGTLSSLTVTGLITATGTGIRTSNVQDSTGTITIQTRYGNVSGDVGIYGNLTVGTSGTGNVTAYNANLGNLVIGNFIQGTLTTGSQPNITSTGTLSSLSVTANISSGNANLGNLATANFFSGNGSLLTSLTGSNITGQVANALIASTVYTNAQPNITSLGTLSSLSVTSNVSAGNVLTNNLLYANGVAWSFGSTYSNTNVAAYLPTYTGNLTAGNAVFSGNATAANFITSGSSGNITGANVISATTFTATGNLTAGNANLGNAATANFFIGNGSLLTGLPASYSNTNVAAYLPTYTGNISSGNANLGNSVTANFFIGDGSLLTGLPASYSNTNVAAYLPTYTGNLTAGNANLGNAATANFFIGNGSLLTGLPASYSNTNVAAYLPTYTGNFTANNANISNSLTANSITTTGSSGNISGANYVTANYFTGTLTTGAQPNVTSLGTLSSLTITGNITSGNANLGNLATSNFFSGNGSLLTSITGSNVTGQVGNALIAGTVYTNSQPNITSVGTLSSLSVTANVSAGNILSDNLLYANGVAWSFGSTYANTNVAAYLPTYTGLVGGTLSTQAQPNVTSVGTLTGLTVSGNASFTGANTYFGNLSNVKIPGGTANYFIKTDGTGNLSFSSLPTTSVTVDTFSANGSANSFTLSVTPSSLDDLLVNINGVFQYKSAYTLAGNVVTLGSTPSNGSTVEVRSILGTSGGGGSGNTSVMYSMGLLFGG